MTTFTHTIRETFQVVNCANCGVPFGITDDLYRRVVTDAIGFVSCPACGRQSHWQESEDQKRIKRLQRELESAKRRADTSQRRAECEADRRLEAEHRLRATKGVVTKMKKRVGKGVCPCCNRHFGNLQKHMESKHPDYTEDGDD